MGVVYLARGRGGALVALKVLRRELVEDPTVRRRFEREAAIARRVQGRCIARLIDADLDGKVAWLATEWVDGPTLAEHVRANGAITGDPLRALSLGLLDALVDLERVGVIHRDLTPNNVLLTVDGPRVVDFGIAAHEAATTLTGAGAVLGTPAWMAPEQVEGRSPSHATDMFAWGAVCAFAALGRSPFGEGSPQVVMYRVVNGEADLEGLDDPLHRVVAAALSKDLADRPSAAEAIAELAGPEEQTLGIGHTLGADWTLPLGGTTEPTLVRRRRVTWIAGAALLVLLIGGGAVVALTRDDGSSEEADSGRRNITASTSTTTTTTTTTTAPATTQAPTTAATTLPPPPPPPRFATVDCAVALGAIDEFTLSDRLQLQALFQGFVGPAPGSGGTALRIVGLPIASQSGDPYDAVWSPDTGFSVTGGFFEFELLDDPAAFPVIVFLDEANNFVCEPNVPTG